jgi:hypothetical protein
VTRKLSVFVRFFVRRFNWYESAGEDRSPQDTANSRLFGLKTIMYILRGVRCR